MARRAAGLTAAAVKAAKPGRYGDGNGLYLLVRPAGGKFWLFRYTPQGAKMREMGLGRAGYSDGEVPLADAREVAGQLIKQVRAGIDPLAQREAETKAKMAEDQRAVVEAITFRQVAGHYLSAHEKAWRNPKHRDQWANTLETYAHPHFGDLPVGAIETGHVLAALEPIWRVKPETAARVRGRIENVLDYGKSRGWRDGENPARWRGHLSFLLPARSKIAPVEHHPALPWSTTNAFLVKLRSQNGTAAQALEFTILTAARTGEVLGAKWDEIDLAKRIWTVPAGRMKARREHRSTEFHSHNRPYQIGCDADCQQPGRFRLPRRGSWPGIVGNVDEHAFAPHGSWRYHRPRIPLDLPGLGVRGNVLPPRGRRSGPGSYGRQCRGGCVSSGRPV